jgi:predicted ATPase
MLTKLYIDNFRCFVNFEIHLGSLCLLFGDNGVGKTSALDVIEILRDFIGGYKSVAAFGANTLTRWQSLRLQTFAMELRIDGKNYRYELVIEHEPNRGQRRVYREQLTLDGQALYFSQLGKAQLYHDDFTRGPEVSFDWNRSGIGFLQAAPDNTYLCRFREFVGDYIIVGLEPRAMSALSEDESDTLDRYGREFVSWYRGMALEYPAAVADLTQELRKIFPGFSALTFRESGDKRILKAQFNPPESTGKSRYDEFSFEEVSDGQRCLIVLYSLLYKSREKPCASFMDEPDNFVALREIQPWLSMLEELCGEHDSEMQVLLTSHSPEIINFLGADRAMMLERPSGGATRVKNFQPVEGLSPAETIARGWE